MRRIKKEKIRIVRIIMYLKPVGVCSLCLCLSLSQECLVTINAPVNYSQ